jgi:hypothetical protein
MMMDRTKPPTGWHYSGDTCDEFRMDWDPCQHGWTLDEAWAEYDRITLPARVALLRELAAELEFAAQRADTPDGMPCPWGYSDPCEFGTFISVFLTRADALEKP